MTKRELAEILGLKLYEGSIRHKQNGQSRYTFYIGNGTFYQYGKDVDDAWEKASEKVISEMTHIIGEGFNQ